MYCWIVFGTRRRPVSWWNGVQTQEYDVARQAEYAVTVEAQERLVASELAAIAATEEAQAQARMYTSPRT